MTSATVTFQTILVPSRETPKAVMVYGGNLYPKSQVTFEVVGKTTREHKVFGRKTVVVCQIVNITMPRWLAEK